MAPVLPRNRRTHVGPFNDPQIRSALSEAVAAEAYSLPPAMIQAHIHRLLTAVIMLYRPWCMWSLSSHARAGLENDHLQWAEENLEALQALEASHRRHVLAGRPSLMISYADLMWNSALVLQQLQCFLPCAGRLSLDSNLQLGRDIFEENKWKVSGSVAAYGRTNRPEFVHYSLVEKGCTTAPIGFEHNQTLQDEAKRVELYLRAQATAGEHVCSL